MTKYYDELLKICGFEIQEIEKERPRIEEAFQRLELEAEDMKIAESWVKQNHDMELMGIRKILYLWIKELIDLVLAKDEGKKLVYYGFPTVAGPAAAIAASSEQVYCVCPDAVLSTVMGQIFNKVIPILEAGERNGLPPGNSFCSLQLTRVGALAKGIIPVPDMVLTSSYYCDMGSKTDELLHERYGHAAIYVDGSMDSRWGDFPDYLPERISFLGGELDKALDKVKEILGFEVTKEARYEGASRNNKFFGALSELLNLMMEADPQPISIGESDLARRLGTASASRRIIDEAPDAILLLNQEVKKRIDKHIGVVEKGAPRVAILFSHFSDPRITRMIEKSGLSIPITILNLIYAKFRKSTPFISGEILAREEMAAGIFYGNYGFITRVAEVVRESNLDGFIWNYLYNCRPVAGISHLLKSFIEKETGIPVLSLESDLVDNRTYNSETMRNKIETFAEMLRARKVSA
jgi:benzoyl-CoA reductase/2-hydroxyglutaryl-CoA dehydratase subunit BcrC/BadD/HgdB